MPSPRYRSTAEFVAAVNQTYQSRRTSADKILTPQEIAAQLTALAAGAPDSTVSASAALAAQPTMLSVKRAMDAGESAGVWFVGDSTGDSDGSSAGGDRVPSRTVRRLAAAYPSHHVLFKHWDPTLEDYKPWTVMQAHPEGRRHIAITNRSVRHVPASPEAATFSTGNMDLRILVDPGVWAPGGSAAERMLINRNHGTDAAGKAMPWGSMFQFRWRIDQAGHLILTHSTTGSTWTGNKVSTAPVPGVNGTPLWLRVTMEINAGTTGSWAVNFYTSPAADGVTWTKLGDTVTFSGSTGTLFNPPGIGNFLIGADTYASGGVPLAGGKVYEVQIRDGINGPLLAPAAVEKWNRWADPGVTYGGAPTLYVLNASRSGSAMSYHADPVRLVKETPDYGQTVLVFNDSHNEVGAQSQTWIPPYEAWAAGVARRLPEATVNVVGQTPHTAAWPNEAAYGAEHRKRFVELSAAAARNGWGFVNLYQAFRDDPRGLGALISADGLHPTQTGYELAGDVLARAMGFTVPTT